MIVSTETQATRARLRFPAGFTWGSATSAFQIEGSTTVDGRVESIWDRFCATPGAVVNGDTGDPGADHYRLMDRDVALMTELGLDAYRFSVAWPRVLHADGTVNSKGLGFYDRLVDRLLDNGITPCLTLYHWDLPQALEDQGGWANRDTAFRFADYALAVLDRLGDRVVQWHTINEPWCSAFLGYASGRHAPGRQDRTAALAAVHHLLLAHGLGMRAIRERVPAAVAGLALNLYPVAGDADAVRRVDGLQNRIFMDPVFGRGYPNDVLADVRRWWPDDLVRDGDLDTIAAPIDVLGINYYRGYQVSDRGETPDLTWVGSEHVGFHPTGAPVTDSGWDVQPDELTDLLVQVQRDYPEVPLVITENGAAYPGVADEDRVAFVEAHLRAAHAAIDQGVDLRGYFYWSLLDNFEWAEGYAKRFGLVHVDFATQERTLKQSARWYADVIRENGF
ncbi:GH1 family beta-glucosidase [Labedaea rhizosphaerae]|uniref:Beta-glucosidase n=1 Tax=Labedaea rhizosphaerae TaxID=598644 RepID=A0A4R6SI05_LABRH|nr:GH1 family beta-glucosidase [Labedaea rhizosphaerae]TDQ01455.1 beta-glucosidase [Labedaea rhizosphaerae]